MPVTGLMITPERVGRLMKLLIPLAVAVSNFPIVATENQVMNDLCWSADVEAQLELGKSQLAALPEPDSGCDYVSAMALALPQGGFAGQIVVVPFTTCGGSDTFLVDPAHDSAQRINREEGRPQMIALVDLIGDEQPEMLVSRLCGMRNGCTNIWRIDGDEPVQIGSHLGTYGGELIHDLEQDGVPELITGWCCSGGACSEGGLWGVARFDGQRFVEDQSVLEVMLFNTTSERIVEAWPPFPSTDSPFSVEVVAYQLDSRHPGETLWLELNDEILLNDERLEPESSSIGPTIEIDPGVCNVFRARVKGPAGSGVVIVLKSIE